MAKFLGPTGLTVLWSRIKAWVKKYAYITSSTSGGVTTNTITIDSKSVIVPSKTSELNNDAGFITGADIPEGAAASSATPLMDGTASAGTSNAFARGDHRHPTDTTRQATITGGASTITSTDLTKNRALISNNSGKVAVSDVTSTELGYLDGVTGNVQTQLNNKANKPSGTITAGHVATLDANGNLVDSGVSTSDIGTDTKDTTGTNPIVFPQGEEGIVYLVGSRDQEEYSTTGTATSVYIGADGKLRSGYGINGATDAQSIVSTASDLSNKADKVSGGTSGNLVKLDSNGNIVDAGVNNSNLVHTTGTEIINGEKKFSDSITLAGSDFSQIRYSENTSGTIRYKTLQGELDNISNNVVHKTGNETISDNKTFSGKVIVTDPGEDGQVIDSNEILIGMSTPQNASAYPAMNAIVKENVSGFQWIIAGETTLQSVLNSKASLDANGKVPTSQLPSYVDDVVEAYIRSGQTALSSGWLATGSASGTVITPETGVIYIIMNGNSTYPTNSEYRWSGSSYVQLYDGGCTEMTESEMNIAVMGSDTDQWT